MRKLFNSTRQLPMSIWGIGLVSLFINISSVIVFSLSPIYLTEILGITLLSLGILEGIVEALSWFMRLFSGILSDVLNKRKPFLFMSYALITLSRPILAIATSVVGIFAARSIDRIGNGLQAPPREALVGDHAPKHLKGASYGLRQSLSVLGSVIGAVLIQGVILNTSEDYRRIFWYLAIPPVIAIVILVFFVKDRPSPDEDQPGTTKGKKKTIQKQKSFKLEDISHLNRYYWRVVILGTLFMMSNYSGAFMILQIKELGLSSSEITNVMVVQNLMTMLAAYPIGRLSDSIDRRIPLAFGFVFVIFSDIMLGLSNNLTLALVGVGLWGLQLGMTQSLLLTEVADTAPDEVRGTAFGLYYICVGLAIFAANYISGHLSKEFHLEAVFWFSAFIATLSLFALPLIKKQPFRTTSVWGESKNIRRKT